MKNNVFIGIDIGTQGVRIITVDELGNILGAQSLNFPLTENRQEQSPDKWMATLLDGLKSLMNDLNHVILVDQIQALSVTSTSGTMIALDNNYHPLSPAIMYSDKRSYREAEKCRQVAEENQQKGYTSFNTSSGLPKILWFAENYPYLSKAIKLWAHATDFVIGNLSGVWGITDYTNSLKTGYDLNNEKWPDYITGNLGLSSSWFPKVVPSGEVLGLLSSKVADYTGLPKTTKVVSGMTDGCASQIASGSIKPGQWNTTIGTTLVVKGVTKAPIEDPLGRLYNHKHPNGYWMPGGASNTGADWVSKEYSNDELPKLNEQAEKLIPTLWISYPLQQKGERFPFVCREAMGFSPEGLTKEELYVSNMEGVAYLERLSYEMIESLSGERIDQIYTAGGASNNEVWMKIRSNVLQKPVLKMKHIEGAMGAGILAASGSYFGDIQTAGESMIKEDKVILPGGALLQRYEEGYEKFIETLQSKQYLKMGKGAGKHD